MAKTKATFLFLVLAALLIGALVAYMWTGEDAHESLPGQARKEAFVDQGPVRTARALTPLAATAEEQQLAFEAIRIADDEVDLAFDGALLEAQAHPPVPSPESREMQARMNKAQTDVQSDQARVQRLEVAAKSARQESREAILEQLDVAKAQLDLDQDGLDDARQDLKRSGGDPVARIQALQAQHESREHGDSNSPAPQIRPSSFHVSGATLESHVEDWWQLHTKQNKLNDSRLQALNSRMEILSRMDLLRHASAVEPQGSMSGGERAKGHLNSELTVKDLHTQQVNQKIIATYDKRRLDLERIYDLYANWIGISAMQIRVVWHAVLRVVLVILVILLGVAAALLGIDRIYREKGTEDRRLLTTRVAYRSAIQAVGLVLLLLVLFGIPNQVSTVLALAGAGLTVALKDFILGFFGWFTLMGRNGIRVGDWVEINGIGGEVIEIGLLRTVLLETGNWNDAGHPTGRKVAFVNSFAIEGHYFNFTTSGQWLWDEIDVPIPPGEDPYALTEAIRKIIDHETATYASSAEQEWQRATHNVVVRPFSAAPAVDVRPTSSGMNLMVRYITQASGRHELRSRLYQEIVALLYGRGTSRLNSAGNSTAEGRA